MSLFAVENCIIEHIAPHKVTFASGYRGENSFGSKDFVGNVKEGVTDSFTDDARGLPLNDGSQGSSFNDEAGERDDMSLTDDSKEWSFSEEESSSEA